MTIPPGATMRVAAESLSHAHVISFARGFRLYASLRGNDRDIRAGTYLFHRNASWSYVLDALRAGKGLVHIVTIPEGFSLAQIESSLETKLGAEHDSIVAAGARHRRCSTRSTFRRRRSRGISFPTRTSSPTARHLAPLSRRWCTGSSKYGSRNGPPASRRFTFLETT